jgi:two-component system, chemotaxis family, chemotaxis protein CheY
MHLDIAVLVVDDSPTARRIVRVLLVQLGFSEIDEADGGSKALELLEKRHYSLIISDWHMSPMNGIEFVGKVRAMAGGSGIRIIMMSGQAAESSAAQLANTSIDDFDDFISKPFTAFDLRSKIKRLIQVDI